MANVASIAADLDVAGECHVLANMARTRFGPMDYVVAPIVTKAIPSMLLRLCHLVCLLCLAAGCATLQTTKPQGYQTSYEQTYGSTSEAIAKHRAALRKLDKCDLCGAEELLKESLAEDEKFGLTHSLV